MNELRATFGSIDIYLFDQLLRGQIRPGCRVVDAGCGFGRNIHYFLRSGYDVFAFDSDAVAVADVKRMAAELAPQLPPDHVRHETVEQCSLPDGLADVVISSAVLHFARDDAQFAAMLTGTWRLVAPGGLLFCRLASTIGIASLVHPLAPDGRRCRLPDGTDRYLVDQALLLEWTGRLGGQLVDPLKTTVVQDLRAMTTWVVRRPA